MTITTKDVETRLRAALEATIPQLLSDDTQLPGSTEQPAARDEELLVLAPARSEAGESRSVAAGWRLIGAAAAGVILVGGLAIAHRQQGEPAPVAQAPTPSAIAVPAPPLTVADLPAPALRPDVFAVVPDSYPNADLASAMWGGQVGGTGTTTAEALVALVDAGTASSGVRLSVDSESGDSFPGPAQAAQVAGLEVQVYVENGTPALTTVVLPGSPTLAVTGQDPIQFIEDAGGIPIQGARIDSSGNVTFAVGALPSGYEVVVPPSQLPVGSVDASTRVPDGDGGDGLAAWVQVRNPLISYAQVGELQQVDVHGTTGWMIDNGPGSPVMWPASPTTWALISGATNADIALEFARSVDFVDEETWAQRYDVEPANFPPPDVQTTRTDVTDTTIEVEQPDLIAINAVVCVDAGASERAVRLCLEELGGDAVIEATRTFDESFVMPIDPTDPSHVADTAALGNALSIPIVDFNVDYLPVGVLTNPASTIYLVLGRNDVPYAQ